MSFIYAGMGFAIGLMLLIFMRKENKAFYFFSFVFLFMGSWWLLDEITNINFFEGNFLIIFRVMMAISIIVAVLVYFKERKTNEFKDYKKDDKDKFDKPLE